MKRKLGILAVAVALVAGAAGIGWLYFRLNPAAWDDFVAEMRGETTSSAAPRPVQRPARKAGGLFASGAIEAEEVTVAAEMGGRIVALLADEGDEVVAGEVLVRLDQTMLLAQREQAEAAVAQAQAGLDAARAQLAQAKAGARDEEIAMAEGQVDSAQAGLEAAQGQQAAAEAELKVARAQLTTARVGQTNAALLVTAAQADLDRAKAQLAQVQAGATEDDIAMAQSAVDGAQAQLDQWQAGPDEETVEIAKLNWDLARNALWQAQLERDATKGTPGVPGYQKDLVDAVVGATEISARIAELQHQLAAEGATDEQLRVAQAAVSQAQAQLDKVKAGARSEEVDMAEAGVDAAQAQLAQAEAGIDAAQANVDTAQAGMEAAQAAAIIAQAGTDAAQAQLDQAQASLDLLKAGARREEISLLEANVAQAEAALAGTEAALKALDAQVERMTLAAPVGGIVVERLVHVGELASPGGSLFTLTNLDEVTLTVYVPETDLGQVWLSQTVEVAVDAYGDVFSGQVSHIASQAEFTPKNVQTQEERVHMVFAVKIQLDNADHRLKPGMPADATFQ
jgi:HlyD family secretion protein